MKTTASNMFFKNQ